MAYAVGIDVGTTNVKVVLVGSDGQIAASAAQRLSTRRMGEVAEQDAEALWSAVVAGIGDVAAGAPQAARKVVSIGCCSQYSSIVPVRADGTPVAHMVLWQDKRGTDHSLRLLAAEGSPEVWLEHHGIVPVGDGLSLAHILHLQKDRPDVHAKTAAYLEPMDYVNARLTGRIAANQATMFMSQLCDNRVLGVTHYDDTLVRLSGVDAAKLPPLDGLDSAAGTLRPKLAIELGLPRHVLVAGGMNDSHAGLVATGARQPGRAGLAIGTTSVLIDVVDRHGSDLQHGIVSMPTPFDTYLVWAETGIGGRALEFMLDSIIHVADEVGNHSSANLFAGVQAAIERAPAGSNGALFLPWLNGSLSPVIDSSVRGAFLNITLETRLVDLIRAITEGVAHSLRWLLPFVEAYSGNGIHEVAFHGGAAHSAAWSQVLADVLDRPVLVLGHPDFAVAHAVALSALERHGDVDADELVRSQVIGRRARPSPDHRDLYRRMHEQFRASYAALRPVFRALNT